MRDELLAVRVREGDQGAFEQLRRSRAKILRMLARRAYPPNNGVDFDDMCQEADLAFYKAVLVWNPSRGPLNGIVVTVVDRHLINWVRQECRQKRRPDDKPYSLDAPAPDAETDLHGALPSLADVEIHAERLDLLARTADAAKSLLSPFERRCIMGHAAGLSYQELAQDRPARANSQRPCKSVDNAIQKGRRKLLEHFAEAA